METFAPLGINRVSCASRAGWLAGVLSASKQYHSVSRSEASATVKPARLKMSQILRIVAVSGWIVPRVSPHGGRVASGLSPSAFAISAFSRRA